MESGRSILLIVFLIPLILSIGIAPAIPFSEAVEYSQICIDKVWIESTKGRIACVTPSTAEKLVERGWGSLLSEDVFDEHELEPRSLEMPHYPDQPAVNPDFDAHTANFWPPEIIKVTDGVWQATGYGLANSIMIEGEDGIIIVDAMMSHESATEVMEEFRKITDKPVKAIVYSHSHPDHINGAGAFAQYADDDLEIFAHSTFLDNYYHESGELGKIIATRGLFYYGVFLPQDGPDRFVSTGIGPFLETGDVSTSFIVPTTTFDDKLEVEVAGLKMVLIHTPSETNDEIVVWFPETQVLVGSEVLYKLWPNLYSIRGSSYRDVKSWIESLQTMIDLDAKYLALSHTQPVRGSENVKEVLTAYHDGVQYIYDQTIRGINNGMTVDELVNTIDLPQSLKDHPWLQERYGERPWHIRGIYSGNIGWFQGDSAFLNPISFQEQSIKIVEGFGGVEKTIEKVRDAIDKGEYEWASMLSSYIIEAEPDNKEAKLLKAFSLRVLGQQAHTSGARNWYLTDALVLEEKIIIDPSVVALTSPETIAATPIEILLEQVPTRLDPAKAEGFDMIVGLELSDSDESFTFHVRNSIVALTPGLKENLDVKLIAEESTIKLTLAGQKMLEDSINDGTISVEGNMENAIKFISLFDPYVQASQYAN